jgi:hypothetical protein
MDFSARSFAPILWVCAVGLGAAAHAQVVRCTDARTGKVTYTDGTCASGAAVREVEARKTPAEIQLEREQAAEALERKQQRQQAEAEAAEAEAQRQADLNRARAAQAAAAAPQPQDYARSPECARSRRNLDIVASGIARSTYEQEVRLEAAQRQVDMDCLGPAGYAEVEKARAAQPRVVVVPPARHRPLYPEPFPRPGPPPPKPHLTQCGDFRCTDNLGNTYPRTGPGRFPGQGGVCRSNGGQAPC